MSKCDIERKYFFRGLAALAVTALIVLASGCDESKRGVDPSEDGTCYPAYGQDGEVEENAVADECLH